MPTLTALRLAGTHFRKAFVPSPLCAPSRACLAGAREYDDAGVPDNFSNDYPLNHTTYYTLLREAGYTVMTSGKDDLTKATGPGLNGSFHADGLGFTKYARCDGKSDAAGSTPHDPYGLFCSQHYEVVGGQNESFFAIYNADMKSCQAPGGAAGGYDCIKPSPLPEFAYEDNYVGANAAALLQSKPQGVPWFLQVSFPGPHPPFVVTAPMKNTTAGFSYPLAADNPALPTAVQQEVRRDYAAELVNLDRNFALVLGAIPPAERANTVVIVASDHGEMLGDHQTWGKTMPWQGSVSVPLFISGPGLAANAIVDAPVGTMDIAGTVLDLAGVAPVAGMTTLSLLPFVNGSAAPEALYRPFVSSGLSGGRAAGEGWRAVVQARREGTYKLLCCRSSTGVCDGAPSRANAAPLVGASGEDEDGRYEAVAPGARSRGEGQASAAAKDEYYLYDVMHDVYDMQGAHALQGFSQTSYPPQVKVLTSPKHTHTRAINHWPPSCTDRSDLKATKPTAVSAMLQMLPKGWCH